MEVVADLHLHSKYSRAVSQQMILPEMAKWAKRKGIDLLGTGDFTHPLWFRELKSQLEEAGEGVYKLKSEILNPKSLPDRQAGETNSNFQNSNVQKEMLFLLSTEISSIYSQGGKLRRIHNLVFAPSLELVEKINNALLQRGANLMSDGRPIIGLSARDLAELVLSVDENCLVVPAHAWTPWFSLYGSESGFDSINECFGDIAKSIYAVETGLSSNPEMNWRIAELDGRSIISFSDAHSGAKLGREATVFEVEDIKRLGYKDIRKAIIQKTEDREQKTENAVLPSYSFPRIVYTIEFHPEEGKYHFTGHRNCKVRQSPEETKAKGATCPVCGKGLTVGVMHRVEQLTKSGIRRTRSEITTPASRDQESGIDGFGVRWIKNTDQPRPPYVMLVPLLEILAESFGSLPSSQRVINEYNNLTDRFKSEFAVLLETPVEEIAKLSGEKIAEGVSRVRRGEIVVEPGYDGVFGTVKIWASGAPQREVEEKKDQLSLF